MIIKTPEKYICEEGILKKAGFYIKEYAKKPLIIGGKTALKIVGEDLKKSLEEYGVSTKYMEQFCGYPSERQIQKFGEIATNTDADAIIGIGGGRVIDTAKAVGDMQNLPVITIPTVAATCAAWAGLTVQYNDEGAFVKMRPLKHAPKLILADTKVLLSSPKRYLYSGVVDTFAKFYEIRPSLVHAKKTTHLEISLYASEMAFKKLEKNMPIALAEAKNGIFAQAAENVVDSIIYLAGFAGSFQTEDGYYSFAHPFYHISTRFPDTRQRLHGEKVAYGILVQLHLEQKNIEEIEEAIKIFASYDNAFQLSEIGFDLKNIEELKKLAVDIKHEFSYVGWSVEEIVHSLLEIDKIVKEKRKWT